MWSGCTYSYILGPDSIFLLMSPSLVSTETQFWMMSVVVFQASLLPRLGRTPSWMKTLDQPALFLSAMEVVID